MEDFALKSLKNAYRGELMNRTDPYIHVSDCLELCPRRVALSVSLGKPMHPKQHLNLATSFTFEIGRAVQKIVVNRYKRAGVLVGTWHCLYCDNKFFGFQCACPKCGNSKFVTYTDTTLINDDYGIRVIGNVDIILMKTLTEAVITEAKSIKPDSYDALTEPELSHYRQLSLYIWMVRNKAKINCKKTDDPRLRKLSFNTDNGVVLYCCKLHKPMPFKTFKITPDEDFLHGVENKLQEVKRFTETKEIPERICSDRFNLVAKKCAMRVECFEE